MTCCGGRFLEVTSHDDNEQIYICQECGKTGPEQLFPDDPPEPPANRRWRDTVAGWLYRIADKISQ